MDYFTKEMDKAKEKEREEKYAAVLQKVKNNELLLKKDYTVLFNIVRDYLYEHQGENIVKVSKQTQVPTRIIMKFLKEGRISIVDDGKSLLKQCSICGVVITGGTMCEDCLKKEFAKSMQQDMRSSRKKFRGRSAGMAGDYDKEVGRRRRYRKN